MLGVRGPYYIFHSLSIKSGLLAHFHRQAARALLSSEEDLEMRGEGLAVLNPTLFHAIDILTWRGTKHACPPCEKLSRNPPIPPLSKGGRGGFLKFAANLRTTLVPADQGHEQTAACFRRYLPAVRGNLGVFVKGPSPWGGEKICSFIGHISIVISLPPFPKG